MILSLQNVLQNGITRIETWVQNISMIFYQKRVFFEE